MNNRNQQPTRPVQQPLAPSTVTHLNVFTVEEYESNGKTGKRWTYIRKARASATSLRRFRWMAGWSPSRLTETRTIAPVTQSQRSFWALTGPVFQVSDSNATRFRTWRATSLAGFWRISVDTELAA